MQLRFRQRIRAVGHPREQSRRAQPLRQLAAGGGAGGFGIAVQTEQNQPGGRTAAQLFQQQFRHGIGAGHEQGQIGDDRRGQHDPAASQHGQQPERHDQPTRHETPPFTPLARRERGRG
ncbi:MAG: hypothetical protein V9H25_17805 [Candidatus Competibacter sp.]